MNHTISDHYTSGDLEYLVMVMKGLTSSFETVKLDNIKLGLTYIKKCIDAHFEVVNTFTKVFYDDYFILMSRILGRLHYEELLLVSGYENNLNTYNVYLESLKPMIELW